jgi:hypothetical protein
MRLSALAALFAVVIFCLFAAGALAVTPLWIFAALAGVALGVAGAAGSGV